MADTGRTSRRAVGFHPRGAKTARNGGFTMIEIGLAITVLLVALVAMSASTVRMHALRRQNRERTVAHNAIRAICEEIQAVSREGLDDPAGWAHHVLGTIAPGGTLGYAFTVVELEPWTALAFVGSITPVTDETRTDEELGLALGMPRDLDGDGVVSNTGVGDAARILPIVVRARWRGAHGEQEIVHPFYVIGY